MSDMTSITSSEPARSGTTTSPPSVRAAPSVPSSWTNVLGVNGIYRAMPTTGERPDIGPTTEANARWLITQDASAATYALAQAQAAGSIPWHYYDTAKGHYLSVTDYPQLWIDYRGSVQPKQIAGDESGWYPDRAHTPDLSYVAWLLTGDRYHLDMLNAQASWVIANTWNAYRQDAQGIVTHRDEEVRAQAWALRTVQEAAFANPDGSYEKAYFTQIANNNWANLRAKTATLSCHPGRGPRLCPGHLCPRDDWAVAAGVLRQHRRPRRAAGQPGCPGRAEMAGELSQWAVPLT